MLGFLFCFAFSENHFLEDLGKHVVGNEGWMQIIWGDKQPNCGVNVGLSHISYNLDDLLS